MTTTTPRMDAQTPDKGVCPAPGCGGPLADHIGGKPCVVGKPSTASSLHDLPIFGWAWKEDGHDLRA